MIKSDFLRRLRALTIKEWCQLVRDPSSFAVGLVLPLVLIFIFGSGLSLDLGRSTRRRAMFLTLLSKDLRGRRTSHRLTAATSKKPKG